MDSKSKQALLTYHDWFGERAYAVYGKPGVSHKKGMPSHCAGCGAGGTLSATERGYLAFCPVCVTVAGSYQGIKVPGRMGAGWAATLTEKHAKLTTGNAGNLDAFQGLANSELSHSTVAKAVIATLLSPPDPPFMVVAFSQSSADVCKQLRVSESRDRIYLGGGSVAPINARLVRSCCRAIADQGLPQATLKKAVGLYTLIVRGLSKARTDDAKAALREMDTKYAGLSDLVTALPIYGTPEYDWVMVGAYAH